MDSMRTRNAAKIKCTIPQQTVKNEKDDVMFTEDEKKTIAELKQLYLETIKLDVDLQRDIYNMEKSYEVKHNEIFDKRKKILEEFKKQNHGDASPNENVTNFWLKVLKASYTEFISKKDEKILSNLCDIRAKLFNEPTVKFIIEFHFEPNEYIANRVLTKTYFLNCLPDPDDPLSYDGAEIYKCEGCRIEWKQAKDREKKDTTSFFDFFSPPTLPEDTDDPNYCDINAILQNDFELGFYLKERVIPKAVIFFTGEIADCQSSEESESETEESDEESDAEEEEESSTNDTENDK
ncbi:nucleosome assembly protein 1-like 1 isoform X2 [Scaptodrosophila lebanonensis]|uniref:Nucleosome assembly protein 1-like 1 isoform X2 n=1 Tax=Drosophila lebanonensis TaxID=7225 RepID=A0A6J2T4C3_DROLE|nr:nucleosome assembly protein 1-like 1 isoform X2 [Scaptodrosophila lebanonensis]